MQCGKYIIQQTQPSFGIITQSTRFILICLLLDAGHVQLVYQSLFT